jgi:hypothetical protein
MRLYITVLAALAVLSTCAVAKEIHPLLARSSRRFLKTPLTRSTKLLAKTTINNYHDYIKQQLSSYDVPNLNNSKKLPKKVLLFTVDIKGPVQKFLNEKTRDLKNLQQTFNHKVFGYSNNYLVF